MTYNLRGGLGMDGKRSLPRIAQVVKAVAPDVVCFQELHQRTVYGSLFDQARQLQRLLDMPLTFQRTLNLGFGGEGLGIASRFVVSAARRHVLPGGRERRGALEVTLNRPSGPLTVYCTHWGLTTSERKLQAQRIADCVRQAQASVLVCGDLNDSPASASLAVLKMGTGLGDAGAAEAEPTYPADNPKHRIDYVLHSLDLRVERTQVIATLASDHLPLVVEFGVERRHIDRKGAQSL